MTASLEHPMVRVTVDAAENVGSLDLWRHSLGLGGIDPTPVSQPVVHAVEALRPRWIRIFLQEYFRVHPSAGRYDWSRLDPYIHAIASTGANIVAAITLKPPPLYPCVDQTIWQPSSWDGWQELVRKLVHRYSVEQPLVSHWEIGNEPDIGEDGGSPYLMKHPDAYSEYYTRTAEAVRQVFPGARVGGPAMAVLTSEPFPGFLKHCGRTGTPVDFLSWHLYHSEPSMHSQQITVARLLAREFLGSVPELLVTEWNRRLYDRRYLSADHAMDARRAAVVAACILEMHRAGLDGSFYYHIQDQVCRPGEFEDFFSPQGLSAMAEHWNELPHRGGLFSLNGTPRPTYFVFRMLQRLGDIQLRALSDSRAVNVLAGQEEDRLAFFAVNYDLESPVDRVVRFHLEGGPSGAGRIRIYRIDHHRHWDARSLELQPIEDRPAWLNEEFCFQAHLPADSVLLAEVVPSG